MTIVNLMFEISFTLALEKKIVTLVNWNENIVLFDCSIFLETKQRARVFLGLLLTCYC